jgi:DNA-binding MarR family transcriptional regulator
MPRVSAARGQAEGIASSPSQAWRLQHSARLLLQNYTIYEKHTVAALHAAGFKGLKHMHLNVIRHIDLDGTRMAELAQRMHVTKAAMTTLIAQCERDGYVTVGVDPNDGRARLVRFSGKGQRLMASFKSIVTVVEAEIESILGARGYESFHKALMLLRDEFTVARLKGTYAKSPGRKAEIRMQPPRLRAGPQK